MSIEPLESRAMLSGGVPPGIDLAQANWFYQNTFAAPASVAPEWNGNVAIGNAGSLGTDYLAAIVARVNAYRWMAGLPGGVTLDATENQEAQQAALIMAANVELSHSPDPTWLDYSAAGAWLPRHSDLTLGVSGTSAIDLDMTDPGAGNTFVGHRRWILYPPTQTMGVGDIPAEANALYVVQPQTPAPAVTAVAWPPAGYVPAPLMPQRWSLQSSPDSDFSRATVAVSENGVPQTVEILSNDDNGYGGNAIVWDLPFAPAPQPGLQTVYSVDVENVLIDGAPQSFSYTTTSFDPESTTVLSPVPAEIGFLSPTVQTTSSAGSIVIEVARSMKRGRASLGRVFDRERLGPGWHEFCCDKRTADFCPGPVLQPDSRSDPAGEFAESGRNFLSEPLVAGRGRPGTGEHRASFGGRRKRGTGRTTGRRARPDLRTARSNRADRGRRARAIPDDHRRPGSPRSSHQGAARRLQVDVQPAA